MHVCPQNANGLLNHHSSPYDWNFGQDFHLFIGVSNTWNLAVVHIEGKQSYSPGMLLVHVSISQGSVPMTIEFHNSPSSFRV